MSKPQTFEDRRKFYGQEYFPYGLDRSGEFSRQRAQLLITHGYAYQELDSGTRKPVNAEEEQFTAVCRGERAAETEHEKAWCQFREKTARPKAIAFAYTPIRSSQTETFTEDSYDYDL